MNKINYKLIFSYLKTKTVQDKNLFNDYKKKNSKGYFSFEKAIIYTTDIDLRRIPLSIKKENIQKQILLPDSKKNCELIESYSALIYFNHFIIDTIKEYSLKIYEEKQSKKRELIIEEYKSFRKDLCLSKDCIPNKLWHAPEDYEVCFEEGDGNNIDMIQEFSLLDSITQEYYLPEIFIFFKEWELTHEKKILVKILDKINLYIQTYFEVFEDKNSYYAGVRQLTTDLNHNTVYKDIETLFIKFFQILELAKHHFKLGIENNTWGDNCFVERYFDKEVPNKWISLNMIEILKEDFPEKNEFEVLCLQNTYSAIARGKDLYNILFSIVNKLDDFSEEEKQLFGVIDKTYSDLTYLFDYTQSTYETFVYNNKEFYSNDIEQYSVIKSRWEKMSLAEKKEHENAIRVKINNIDLDFFKSVLSTNNIEELMLAKQKYLKELRRYIDINNETIKLMLETKVNEIIRKIEDSIKDEDDYPQIYQILEQDFSKYEKILRKNITLLNSLASAEYLYSIYIINSKEKQDFDYSCISIMYYMALENFLNTLVYKPYKKKILEPQKEEVKNSKLFLSDPKYFIINNSFFKKNCELGSLGHLCSDVESTIEFGNFLKNEYSLTSNDLAHLKKIGEEILSCTKNRNDAAHGTEIISYARVVKDKEYVYPITSPEKAKGLLMSLMEILFDNKE